MTEPRGQRTPPGSREPVARPILRGPGPNSDRPHPPEPDPRTTRATALNAAARIHTGRGTTPHRVIADAEIIAEWLRTGVVPEEPEDQVLTELLEQWQEAMQTPCRWELTPYEPPHVEPPKPSRRRWRR